MSTPILKPEPPDPLVEETRAFWRDLGKTLIRESIGTIDETARQIVGVAGILEGLYFHAITFGDICTKRLGISRMHRLRHTFAHAMEDASAPLTAIQRRLGHTSPATTGLYMGELRRAENAYLLELEGKP